MFNDLIKYTTTAVTVLAVCVACDETTRSNKPLRNSSQSTKSSQRNKDTRVLSAADIDQGNWLNSYQSQWRVIDSSSNDQVDRLMWRQAIASVAPPSELRAILVPQDLVRNNRLVLERMQSETNISERQRLSKDFEFYPNALVTCIEDDNRINEVFWSSVVTEQMRDLKGGDAIRESQEDLYRHASRFFKEPPKSKVGHARLLSKGDYYTLISFSQQFTDPKGYDLGTAHNLRISILTSDSRIRNIVIGTMGSGNDMLMDAHLMAKSLIRSHIESSQSEEPSANISLDNVTELRIPNFLTKLNRETPPGNLLYELGSQLIEAVSDAETNPNSNSKVSYMATKSQSVEEFADLLEWLDSEAETEQQARLHSLPIFVDAFKGPWIALVRLSDNPRESKRTLQELKSTASKFSRADLDSVSNSMSEESPDLFGGEMEIDFEAINLISESDRHLIVSTRHTSKGQVGGMDQVFTSTSGSVTFIEKEHLYQLGYIFDHTDKSTAAEMEEWIRTVIDTCTVKYGD